MDDSSVSRKDQRDPRATFILTDFININKQRTHLSEKRWREEKENKQTNQPKKQIP